MNVSGAPHVASLPEAQQETAFLFLGNGAPAPGVRRVTRADRPYAAILLTSRIEPAELAAALEQARDPAVPIADFGENRGLRSDFVGRSLDLAGLTEAKQHFAPIDRRLVELPFRAAREERAELTILRLAYSRGTAIEARFAPDSKVLVEYPLLGITVGTRRQLELLAQLDLLRRRHFTRTHLCGRCGSARLNAYEACPQCGGAELVEEALVHHFRCGWQEAESRFTQGRLLVCPKCRRELRHLGVDYDKPGIIVMCRTCGAGNSEPLVQFGCLDCSAVTPSADAASTDWYHYDLTEDGIKALREGHLPHLDIGPLLEGRPRAFSQQEFRLLATQIARVAGRYARPLAVARFTLSNVEAVRREVGSIETDIAFRHVLDAIVDALRTSDFVSAAGVHSIVAAFPETGAAGVAPIVERIRSAIRNTTATALDLAVDVAEGDAITDMLAEGRA